MTVLFDSSGLMARLLLGVALALPLAATIPGVAAGASETPAAAELLARQARSRSEYEALSREVVVSQERLESLAAEVAAVRKDHAGITAALILAA